MNKLSKLLPILLLTLVFTACKKENERQQQSQATTDQELAPSNTDLLLDYVSAEEQQALLQLKALFEQGIIPGYEQRSLAYAYEQHALRLALDFVNQESSNQVFPYDGAFSLEQHKELAQALSLLSYKCGFQTGDGLSVVNYFCLRASSSFMDYLAKVGEGNALIDLIQSKYREQKYLDATTQQTIVLDADKKLDFTNPDHQLFYFLFHTLMNEELQAGLRVQRGEG